MAVVQEGSHGGWDLYGCQRDSKRWLSFGGGTVLSPFNIALRFRGKHFITDDFSLYGLVNHISDEAIY